LLFDAASGQLGHLLVAPQTVPTLAAGTVLLVIGIAVGARWATALLTIGGLIAGLVATWQQRTARQGSSC